MPCCLAAGAALSNGLARLSTCWQGDAMLFRAPLVPGTLIQRYKRFLADVRLDDGTLTTAHCANPGSMMGLKQPGSRVWLAPAVNPRAKLAWSWELIEADLPGGSQLVGINTVNPNRLAEEAILAGLLPELAGYATLRREVRYGTNSRVDLLLTDSAKADCPPKADCYVEVKNCHLMRIKGLAEFPDSVTERGAKHLAELAREVAAGRRAVMLFIVQMRADIFSLAADLDPAYARAFAAARSCGVEALAYTCRITLDGITVDRRIPIRE
jgi:sugar fermentation stimulation protein A